MKASEIKAAAYQAIELLQGARVGGAPLPERKAKRDEANRILDGLPDSWWQRLGKKDSDLILIASSTVQFPKCKTIGHSASSESIRNRSSLRPSFASCSRCTKNPKIWLGPIVQT